MYKENVGALTRSVDGLEHTLGVRDIHCHLHNDLSQCTEQAVEHLNAEKIRGGLDFCSPDGHGELAKQAEKVYRASSVLQREGYEDQSTDSKHRSAGCVTIIERFETEAELGVHWRPCWRDGRDPGMIKLVIGPCIW